MQKKRNNSVTQIIIHILLFSAAQFPQLTRYKN